MAYEYEISADEALIRERWTGVTRMADLRSGIETLRADPDHGPGLDVLADFSDAKLDVSWNEMQELTEWLSQVETLEKVAIVAPTDLEFGTMRVFEALAEQTGHVSNVGVFRRTHEAETWLRGSEETRCTK